MSQLSELVDAVRQAEREPARRAGADGEELVPWQVFTLEGLDVTVHYCTNAFNEFVGLRCDERDEVRITVVERSVSDKVPGQRRAQTLRLSSPLGDRPVVDGTTGRLRHAFVADRRTGWSTFDVRAAEWMLVGDRLASLDLAARAALEDGCQGMALERLAAGGDDLVAVYRERGVPPPDRRAAAKIAVDAALASASSGNAEAPSVGFTLDTLDRFARMGTDQRGQLAELISMYRQIERGFEDNGDARAECERFMRVARDLQVRGGLRA